MLGVLVAGCYTLQPVAGTAPAVGSRVALDVNDIGRVALGGSMGPEIAQIEGRLLANSDEEYLIAVEVVRLLRGGEQIWDGEQVRISRDHIGTAYERRLSRGRTLALGTAVVGGIVAIVVTRDLLGGGREPGTPPDTSVPAIRIPRR
jgi:hypothetical protein